MYVLDYNNEILPSKNWESSFIFENNDKVCPTESEKFDQKIEFENA